jgi:hypothetical protein
LENRVRGMKIRNRMLYLLFDRSFKYEDRSSSTRRPISPPPSNNEPFEKDTERHKEDDRGQGIKDPVNFRKGHVDVGGSVRVHLHY